MASVMNRKNNRNIFTKASQKFGFFPENGERGHFYLVGRVIVAMRSTRELTV
jgi:hypothetical protein